MRWAYTLLLYLGLPLVLLRLWRRGRKNPAYRRRWQERFGRGLPPAERRRLWVHAVSVGEVIAAVPLIERLLARYPEHQLLVTTTTPTGSDEVRRRFGDRVAHVHLPFDLPGAVGRFLGRARPELGVIMETEIWPNLFRRARRQGVPLMLVNARLSPRSYRGYHRIRPFVRQVLADVAWIAAQGGPDAGRFRSLGAPAERVEACGNLKFDLELPAGTEQEGAALRDRLGASRPVWIAASTHEGEEAQVLQAHKALRQTHPEALLILVPRHPERFEDVARLCREQGLGLARRSRDELPAADDPVYLGDTMGELPLLYAAADIAFVGGSLVGTGGHNPLEPAAVGVPVITGPHYFNFAGIYPALLEAGGAVEVADSADLAEGLEAWFANEPRRREAGEAARTVVEANRGTLDRLMGKIAAEMGDREAGQ